MHVEAPDQGISWTGAVGWADKAKKRVLLPSDPAFIASMTKTYVSAATLRLVELGKIALDQPIAELLPTNTAKALHNAGYSTDSITVAHLSSHTSGIKDFVFTDTYQSATLNEPDREWTREEQIALALKFPPKGQPGEKFEYSETNHLLLGEILEQQTGLTFYEAIRKLLKYEEFGLNETWFATLEKAPDHLAPLVHQFAGEYHVESATLHPTFDLFGGGGIAATALDAGRFTQLLFTGQLFDKAETKKLLYHAVPTADGKDNGYYMGIAKTDLETVTCYGHGGFWGTTMQYFPELNASISIFLMERDEWPRYRQLLQQVAQVLEGL